MKLCVHINISTNIFTSTDNPAYTYADMVIHSAKIIL